MADRTPHVFLFRGWSPATQLQLCCSQGLQILVTLHLFPLEGVLFQLLQESDSPLLDLFFVPHFLCFRAKEKPEALQIISTHILVCTLVKKSVVFAHLLSE